MGESGFGFDGGDKGGDVDANPPLFSFGDKLPGDVVGGVTPGEVDMLPEAKVSGFASGGGLAA